MKNFDLTTLNEEQLKPVLHTEGALMVTAGAGSGKTRLLTHRIAHLITDKNVSKYNILAITFTNKAAMEMRERLIDMVDCEGMWIMTFHAMCARILRRDIDKLGFTSNFSIYSESDKERVVKRIIKDNNFDAERLQKVAMNAIGDIKNSNITIDEYVRMHTYLPIIKDLEKIIRTYNDELKNSNSLDFDDLLTKTLELLKLFPDVLEKYQDKFHYIMVDEFQDTNEVQYEITKLLASKYGNVFVVGDEDQSIYGWRGANFKNLLNITKDFNCAIYPLERNYRSTKKILNAANSVIKNNTSRIDKTLWTENGDGARIEIYSGNDESAEAEYVASQIYALRQSYGYAFSDFAILLRMNALSRPFEEKLLTYNIPHIVFGGFKFYERKEIKDLTAYLKVVSNYRDAESLLRIINYPKRGIGDSVVGQLKNYCALENKTMTEIILDIKNNKDLPLSLIKKVGAFSEILTDIVDKKDNTTLSALVSYVIKRSGIQDTLNDDNEENINRRMNVDDFLSSVQEYEDNNTSATLDEFLQSVTLYTDLDTMDDKNNSVSIATMHAAKGLEFKIVFIVGLDDGIMPISRALDYPGDLEEERRLMYVAITRAKERLYLTRAKSRFLYGARKYTLESRFLAEAEPERMKKTITEPEQRSVSGYTPQFNRTELKPITDVDFSGYTVGKSVLHAKFGEGEIISVIGSGNNTFVSVDFKSVGVKNLSLSFAKLEIIG